MSDPQNPQNPQTLVLASTSRYRAALLGRLAVPFLTRAPDCDEEAFRHLAPDEQAMTLARRKAESLPAAELPPGALVIGSDQVVDLAGTVLPKPGTPEAALLQLVQLSGRAHRLITAVAVHQPATGVTRAAVDVHVLHMRPLPEALLRRYLAVDQPLDCAGSYRLEGRGLALFARIEADPETADDTAIIGLPLMKLCALLSGFGHEVLSA